MVQPFHTLLFWPQDQSDGPKTHLGSQLDAISS